MSARRPTINVPEWIAGSLFVLMVLLVVALFFGDVIFWAEQLARVLR